MLAWHLLNRTRYYNETVRIDYFSNNLKLTAFLEQSIKFKASKRSKKKAVLIAYQCPFKMEDMYFETNILRCKWERWFIIVCTIEYRRDLNLSHVTFGLNICLQVLKNDFGLCCVCFLKEQNILFMQVCCEIKNCEKKN